MGKRELRRKANNKNSAHLITGKNLAKVLKKSELYSSLWQMLLSTTVPIILEKQIY